MAEAQFQGGAAQPQGGVVNVKFGMYNVSGPYGGMTVKQMKTAVGQVKPQWEVDNTTRVFDGKKELDDSAVVGPGMQIELVKRMGEKGQ